VLAVCERIGANEIGDVRASSLCTVTQMVASGIGLTLLPSIAADVEGDRRQRIALLPFVGSPPHRTIGLAWRKTSPRGKEFLLLGEHLRLSPRRA